MRAVLLLALFLISATALAEIYSWRDADGGMHYSDIPPLGQVNARKIEPAAANPGDVERARQDLANKEAEFRKRQQATTEAAAKDDKEKVDAAEKLRNCDRARSYLKALESGVRISSTDENGERMFLDDQRRQQEAEAAARAAESWCK